MYGVADESLTCPFFMPLLVAFRRISSKRATKFSGRKHACALAITCVMGDKSNVACNNIIMLASFSATCVCEMGAGIEKVVYKASILKQKWLVDLVDLDFEFSFSFSLPLAPSPLGHVVGYIKQTLWGFEPVTSWVGCATSDHLRPVHMARVPFWPYMAGGVLPRMSHYRMQTLDISNIQGGHSGKLCVPCK